MSFFIDAKKWSLIWVGLLLAVPSPGLPLPSILIYGPTAGCLADNTPGVNVTIWDTTQWAAATTADFAAFNAIVFADCYAGGGSCFTDTSPWATAVANQGVWSPAITGNVVLIGTDPDEHGQTNVIYDLVNFAAGGSGTGLYMALSCAYISAASGTPVQLLAGLGTFTVEGDGGCNNQVEIISASSALTGLTNAMLSNWTCSVHEGFDSWPSNFIPLAIATDGSNKPFTAPDGTQGIPYILASGVTYIPTPTMTFSPTVSPTPTWTLTITPTPTITLTPTITETYTPTLSPTFSPTFTPTTTSTATPTRTPTTTPTPSCVPQVWPDPFDPRYAVDQKIKFGCVLPNSRVSVYTLSGEKVWSTEVSTFIYGSPFTSRWDGKNSKGYAVSPGVYFYVIEMEGKVQSKGKFIVLSGP